MGKLSQDSCSGITLPPLHLAAVSIIVLIIPAVLLNLAWVMTMTVSSVSSEDPVISPLLTENQEHELLEDRKAGGNNDGGGGENEQNCRLVADKLLDFFSENGITDEEDHKWSSDSSEDYYEALTKRFNLTITVSTLTVLNAHLNVTQEHVPVVLNFLGLLDRLVAHHKTHHHQQDPTTE